MSYSSFHP